MTAELREAIRALRKWDEPWQSDCGPITEFRARIKLVVDAAESTLPKTKIEWRVWWECLGVDYSTPENSWPAANKKAEEIRGRIRRARFVHVTGPHEVSP
jgi:hypothetical protein